MLAKNWYIITIICNEEYIIEKILIKGKKSQFIHKNII